MQDVIQQAKDRKKLETRIFLEWSVIRLIKEIEDEFGSEAYEVTLPLLRLLDFISKRKREL